MGRFADVKMKDFRNRDHQRSEETRRQCLQRHSRARRLVSGRWELVGTETRKGRVPVQGSVKHGRAQPREGATGRACTDVATGEGLGCGSQKRSLCRVTPRGCGARAPQKPTREGRSPVASRALSEAVCDRERSRPPHARKDGRASARTGSGLNAEDAEADVGDPAPGDTCTRTGS